MMKRWKLGFASQNLLRLWRKTCFAHLSPPADALMAYFSQTVLNRVFDKDYAEPEIVS